MMCAGDQATGTDLSGNFYANTQFPNSATTVNLTFVVDSGGTAFQNGGLGMLVWVEDLNGGLISTLGNGVGSPIDPIVGGTNTATESVSIPGGLYRLHLQPSNNYATSAKWHLSVAVQGGCNSALDPAESCGCDTVGATKKERGGPVSTLTGMSHETATDLSLGGRGDFPLEIDRTYQGLFAGSDSPFGYGGSFNYGTRLLLGTPSGGVTLASGTGARSVFFQAAGAAWSGWDYTQFSRVSSRLHQNANGSFTLSSPPGETFQFDSTGRLTSITDRNGNVTTLTYPPNQIVVADGAGRSITFTLTGLHITQAADSAGRTVTYIYDGSGNLTDVTDAAGAHTKYGYDGAHRLTSIRAPKQTAAGVTTKDVVNTYDGSGRVITQTDNRRPTPNAMTFDYTTIAGATKVTDAMGNVSVDYYANGVLWKTTSGYGAGVGVETSLLYEYASPTMAVTKVTIAGINRVVVTNTYDSVGNLLTSTDALSHTRTMAGYDTFRHPATVTDPAGVTTTFTFDTHGNLTTRSTPIGNGQNRSMTFSYDPVHPADLVTILDPNGKTWTYGHDAYGFTTSVIDPAGDKTTMAFDAVGRPISSVSPRGNKSGGNPTAFTTNYTTDAYGQVLTATDPLAHVQTWHYDANRNLDWSKDANLHQTNYGYDDANERTTTQRPDGSTLTTSFRADGLISAQIDAAGRSTAYGYDALGRTVSVTDPDNCKTAYTYDGAGNLATKTDPNTGSTCNGTATGVTSTYGYDAASRLTTITYSDGTTPNVAFTYDPAGRRQTMVDGTGTTTYTWDNLSELLSSTDGSGSTVRYGWDPAGNNTTIAYPGGSCTTPASLCVTQAFDPAGRMTSTTDWLGNTTQFTPDENSNVASITYPAGSGNTDTYSFDNADRFLGITNKQGAGTLATQTLTRANTGLLGSVNQNGLAGPGARYFGYTNNDRLCYVATGPGTNPTCASPPAGAQKYTYDSADNLTQQLDGTIQAMDPANRLCYTAPAGTTPTACATPPAGATTFGSDSRGNRTAKTPPGGAATSYTYDQANRLTTATVSSQSGATGQYTSLTPARIADSTNGTGIPAGQVGAGATATIQVTGQGGIPATGASAVALELTTANQTSASCLTAYPSDQAAPTAANLCYTTNKPISNLAIVKPGADGKIKILNAGFGATDLFVDTQGWYGAGTGSGSFNAVTPARIADTRPASSIGVPAGQIPANGTLLVPITGQGGVPTTGVASVTANVSVLNATGTGFVVAYPADAATPNTRTVSYNSGQPMSGLDNVKVATGANAGKIKLTNTSTTPIDVVVDVQGWTATTATPTGAGYQPVVPARVYDSRSVGAGTAFAAGETRSLQIAGQGGVPATGATAVAVTITALGQSGVGYLTAYQAGTTLPATANLVYPSNQAASNLAIVSLSSSGQINLTNLGFSTTQAVIDVSGYYSTDTATWTYAYDGSGLRQAKTGPPARAGLTGTTKFMWGAGSTPNVLVETNTATAGNQPDITRYVYGPDGLPATQITSVAGAAPTVTYLHHDQQGSTVLATNSSGANVGTWAYDPYGNITATTGTATTRLGYNGEYRDAETGFIYLRNRYYEPASGQFLTRDPANATTRSAYGYVYGNPLNRTDPSGLIDLCPPWDSDCWKTSARTVVNMVGGGTALGAGVGLVGGGDCYERDGHWECDHVSGVSSQITFGDVILNGGSGRLPNDRFEHEANHSNQWALFGGGPGFVLAYAGDWLLHGGRRDCMWFENAAGAHKGGYSPETCGCGGGPSGPNTGTPAPAGSDGAPGGFYNPGAPSP